METSIHWATPSTLAVTLAFAVVCVCIGILIGIFIGLQIQYSEYPKDRNNVDAQD